ncbi:hypothetical protein [Rhizobium rhizogenes]|uniref:hypothetical protein n=1 Tax=Rhizobium rhizogenes TaxID=359 RepID=UPI0015722E3C|nr:hypothetical protein [Rhizobium rhizogenes]NTF63420.1 hypothetical protein [Rhizobium rhizogenes]NTG94752.1 hypothetical protein [Rhizobium rhizogenes]
MKNEMLNLRRFFRNRFSRLLDLNDADGSGAGDGSAVALSELCGILATDDEPFPRHYDRDLRQLCTHEANIWFREERGYGDVARLVSRVVEARGAGNTRPCGFWVSEVLRCDSLIDAMRRPDTSSN